MTDLDQRRNQEFSAMDDFYRQQEIELERNHIRKIENISYLCAANCTKDNYLSTRESKECVIKCMKPIETVQNILAKGQAQLKEALVKCTTRCQEQVKVKAADNPFVQQQEEKITCINSPEISNRSHLDKTSPHKGRGDGGYLECAIDCPKRMTPVISQAFQDMKLELERVSRKF